MKAFEDGKVNRNLRLGRGLAVERWAWLQVLLKLEYLVRQSTNGLFRVGFILTVS